MASIAPLLRLLCATTAGFLVCAASAADLHHPLDLRLPGGAVVENCADPTILKGQRPGDPPWTLICTQDPLNEADRDDRGQLRFRRLPMFRSDDLLHWQYVGDAFDAPPPQAQADAGIWAPELAYADGRYLLYYAITDVVDAESPEPGCHSDSAIGVAAADSPLGPWKPQPGLVVPPRRSQAQGCHFHWTIDPDLVTTPEGRKWLLYGSYDGGLFVQALDSSGLRVQGAAVQIAPGDRYEGPEVVFKDGWYTLFVSASNCCNGELTGYAVFAGRSRDITGPYVDEQGRPLLAARSGGTPVIVQHGDRWIGLGHNSVFQTVDGRWWSVHHAVDRGQGRWRGSTLTRRPVLIGELAWVDGWPRLVASDGPGRAALPLKPAPAWAPDRAGALLWADDFGQARLDSRWHPLRAGAAPATLREGHLLLKTAAGDLHPGAPLAPVWLRDLPANGELLIQTRVALDIPSDGVLPEYIQAGLGLFGTAGPAYLKLVHVAIKATRQTEFGIEVSPQTDAPRYGNSVGGPPGDWTELTLRVKRQGKQVVATAYTRADGGAWVRGGTWVHEDLGPRLRLGLLAMGGAGYTARFDHVRVSRAQLSSSPHHDNQ